VEALVSSGVVEALECLVRRCRDKGSAWQSLEARAAALIKAFSAQRSLEGDTVKGGNKTLTADEAEMPAEAPEGAV
jgi:hypothetical protein